MRYLTLSFVLLLQFCKGLAAQKAPRVDILLAHRTRLLVHQRIDLVIEARNVDVSAKHSCPKQVLAV
jgi:hypothetical protein